MLLQRKHTYLHSQSFIYTNINTRILYSQNAKNKEMNRKNHENISVTAAYLKFMSTICEMKLKSSICLS